MKDEMSMKFAIMCSEILKLRNLFTDQLRIKYNYF